LHSSSSAEPFLRVHRHSKRFSEEEKLRAALSKSDALAPLGPSLPCEASYALMSLDCIFI
jgi:hypothetical protein